MSNVKDCNRSGSVIYLVDDAIVADSDSPTRTPAELLAANRARTFH